MATGRDKDPIEAALPDDKADKAGTVTVVLDDPFLDEFDPSDPALPVVGRDGVQVSPDEAKALQEVATRSGVPLAIQEG